ncbi:Ankyrin repeat protein [Rickettsiales bacterium Ac37b]|nr:Ankyrin repeat protein [Rickettsiales bacterium Ac37b]
MKYLCKQGAKINVQNKDSMTPFHYSIGNGYEQMSKLLYDKYRVNIKCTNGVGIHYLHLASRNGHVQMVNWLLTLPETKINYQDHEGKSAMHWAAANGNVKIIRLLKEHKAKLDIPDNINRTPLHYAAKNGHLEVMRNLLPEPTKMLIFITKNRDKLSKEQKSFINIQDREGRTALHYAVCNGSKENVKFLLSRGAEVNLKDTHGKTALDYANQDLVSLLKNHLEKACDKNNNLRDNNKQNRIGVKRTESLHVQASNQKGEATKPNIPVRSSSLRSNDQVSFVEKVQENKSSSFRSNHQGSFVKRVQVKKVGKPTIAIKPMMQLTDEQANNDKVKTKPKLPVRSSSLRSNGGVSFVERVNRESSVEELTNLIMRGG